MGVGDEANPGSRHGNARKLDGDYEAEDRVSVWIGLFPSDQSFDTYLQEVWTEDEQVRCAFWDDLGVRWLDHDFQEAHFEQHPVAIATLLACGLSYAPSYIPAVQQACEARGIDQANTVMLIFEYDYPAEANFSSPYLTYLGSFHYSTGARPFRRG